jgi:hypothetical protein
MRTDIRYVNRRGESIELGVEGGSLHYLEHEVRDWEWSYSTGKGSGRVASFSRRPSKPTKVKLPVGIAAATAAEGIALRNKVIAIGEPDIAAGEPGELQVGDWSMQCWIIAGEPSKYWYDDRYAEINLTLLVEDPSWTRASVKELMPETETSGDAADFPRDFPLNLCRERASTTVYVAGDSDSPFLWRVYGPATSPYIRVADNLYRVNVDVPEGARLEVDSRARTVTLVLNDGTVTNVYSKRERGVSGSGSYIFEPIPSGYNDFAWGNDAQMDLVTYEVRTAAPYEEG